MRPIAIVSVLLLGAAVSPYGIARAQDASSASPHAASTSSASTVTPAKLVHTVPFDHPVAADGSSPSGTVVVKYKIQKDGTVSDVEFVSGPPELKDAAIASVKQWTYEPAMVSGHAVSSDATAELVVKPPPPAASPDSKAAAPPAAGSVPSDEKPIRVGGNVAARMLVHQVQPIYPEMAKMNHVQGTVVLHAVIARDGTIKSLAYVSGPSELKDCSMDAVKQWRYKPTTLNGKPVEVDTTIAVVYSLY